MKKFKNFINEEVELSPYVASGKTDFNNDAVRDMINMYIDAAVGKCSITPYVAFEKVSKILANFSITLPKTTFFEGNQGVRVFKLKQFGEVMGMKNDGSVVTKADYPYSLYFEWKQDEYGKFKVFSAVADEDDLSQLMKDAEEDMSSASSSSDRDYVKEEFKKKIINEVSKKLKGEYLKSAIGINPEDEGHSLANLKQAGKSSPGEARSSTMLGSKYSAGGPSSEQIQKGMSKRKAGIKMALKGLGNSKLADYVGKAAQSYANLSVKANKLEPELKMGSEGEKRNIQRFAKAEKRGKSIEKAIGKLTKEENETLLERIGSTKMGNDLFAGKKGKLKSREIRTDDEGNHVLHLHGHPVVKYNPNSGDVHFHLQSSKTGGRPSRTTMTTINDTLRIHNLGKVSVRKGESYHDNDEIEDNSWVHAGNVKKE